MRLETKFGQSKVLVIDDMSWTRALLRDMLVSLGFERVYLARNGVDALQKIAGQGFDLIISDQIMDGMTGTELLETLRSNSRYTDVPFIMVSSVREAPVIDHALNLGVDDYLAKPISIGLLQQKIEDVFRRRSATCST
ncbi:MAG: response regulator [Pseudomonadota bacterium]|jgi:CheY-like chemotaxis protein